MGRLRRPLGESMADDDQISVSDDSKILKIVRLKCLEQQQKIQLEEIKNLENELESLQENQNEVDGDFLRSQSDFDDYKKYEPAYVNKCLNAEKISASEPKHARNYPCPRKYNNSEENHRNCQYLLYSNKTRESFD